MVKKAMETLAGEVLRKDVTNVRAANRTSATIGVKEAEQRDGERTLVGDLTHVVPERIYDGFGIRGARTVRSETVDVERRGTNRDEEVTGTMANNLKVLRRSTKVRMKPEFDTEGMAIIRAGGNTCVLVVDPNLEAR